MTDLISRQAAIKYLMDNMNWYDEDGYETDEDYKRECITELINGVPSAEPHWIPCSERLPEEPFGCLVTVWDTDPVTMDEFENILPYFVGWDGEQWNDGDGLQCPFEVIAWMPLPKPYEVNNE